MKPQKRKISAHAFMEDLCSDLGDDRIMAKYAISHAGFRKILATLVDAGLIDPMELYQRTCVSDTAVTKAFVDTDMAIDEMYQREPAEALAACRPKEDVETADVRHEQVSGSDRPLSRSGKLLPAWTKKLRDFYETRVRPSRGTGDAVEHLPASSAEEKRRDPRFSPSFKVSVQYRDDPGNGGLVVDISEKGLQVVGFKTTVGEVSTLALKVDEFLALQEGFSLEYECSFQAECQWVKGMDTDDDQLVAGFRIRSISLRSQGIIRKLISRLQTG